MAHKNEFESSHHHHGFYPVEEIQTPEGNGLVMGVFGDSQEAVDCATGQINEMFGVEGQVIDSRRIDKDSQRSKSVGFGGVKWNATWEPTGPSKPPFRPEMGDFSLN